MQNTKLPHWPDDKKTLWRELQAYYETTQLDINALLSKDILRTEKLSVDTGTLFLDFSKNQVDDRALKLLIDLAGACDLKEKITQMFDGDPVNNTEKRAALHTTLRCPHNADFKSEGANQQQAQVQETLKKMTSFCNAIHSGQHRGYTGKTITDIVNLGVGGSDLGPKMACHALRVFQQPGITTHFVSNIDDTDLGHTLAHINPEKTLFIVASKSFTTQETMRNANSARAWFLASAEQKDICSHFIAVSSNIDRAVTFGIEEDNVFPLWNWVGGRYSLWSSIGLSIALAIGMDNFKELLAGGHEMDAHFSNTPFAQNGPVIMGLLGIVYSNMLNVPTQAIIPYDENLTFFPDYLQQLEMESNGKGVNKNGTPITYQTGQILWGSIGTNSQHSFHQLFHQGKHTCNIDFLLPLSSHYNLGNQHKYLVSNCLAQAQALLKGKPEDEIKQELISQGLDETEACNLAPHKVVPGNKPSTLICYEKMTPRVLGNLIALYEHKVYVQSVIWDINPFDQWGVEYGKQLCDSIEPYLKSDCNTSPKGVDPSTAQIISRYHRLKRKS